MDRLIAAALFVCAAAAAQQGGTVWRQASFDEFRKGAPEDGGANLYVSARGAVQLVNRWDYNGDGNIDLLFVGNHDHSENLDADLYAGLPGSSKPTPLPTNGGHWGHIADFDRDGFADVLVVNSNNGTIGDLDSFVYWGSHEGYSTRRRAELPGIFVGRPAIADFNADGFLDLAFPNGGRILLHPGDQVFQFGSFVYFGSRDGFRADRRLELPTDNAVAAAAGDFDGDGYTDLLFAVTGIGSDYLIGGSGEAQKATAKSLIYWGSEAGLSAARASAFETEKAVAARAADIDGDSRPEPLFLDSRGVFVLRLRDRKLTAEPLLREPGLRDFAVADWSGTGRQDIAAIGKEARVYGGSEARLTLPVHRPVSCEAADVDGDGRPDLLVANHDDGTVFATSSYIFRNGARGLSAGARIDVPSSGANSLVAGEGLVLVLNTRGGHVTRTPTYIYYGDERGRFTPERRLTMYTEGGNDGLSADVDDDGKVDLVLTQHGESQPVNYAVDKGPVVQLPMYGSYGAATADLDRDGWLDLVLSGYFRRPGAAADYSRIFYGSKNGYSTSRMQELDTPGAEPAVIADFDRDGSLDLVFPNRKTGATEGSYIYFGAPGGYSKERRLILPTAHSTRAQAADLDRDGWLDLIFSNQIENGSQFTPLLIYWGRREGFSVQHRTSLPAWGGYGICVADYDRNGYLDIAVPSYKAYKTRKTDTRVFWGGADGFLGTRYTHLPSESGAECMAADFDRDGWIDLLVLNHLREGDHRVAGRPSTHVTDSFLYWNGGEGFRSNPQRIPSVGAHCNNSLDYGNVYDRRLAWGYRSEPFEFGRNVPATLHWEAKTPFASAVRFQVRAAASREALDTAQWGPELARSGSAIGALPPDARWIQYRFELRIEAGAADPEVTAVEFRR